MDEAHLGEVSPVQPRFARLSLRRFPLGTCLAALDGVAIEGWWLHVASREAAWSVSWW